MKHGLALQLCLVASALTGCVTINVYPGSASPVSIGQPGPSPIGVANGRPNDQQLGLVMPTPQTPPRPIDTTWGAAPGNVAHPQASFPGRPDLEVWPPNDNGQCVRPCVPPARAIQGEL